MEFHMEVHIGAPYGAPYGMTDGVQSGQRNKIETAIYIYIYVCPYMDSYCIIPIILRPTETSRFPRFLRKRCVAIRGIGRIDRGLAAMSMC